MIEDLTFERDEVLQTVPKRFARVVDRYPENIAIQTESQALTYRALNDLSMHIAAYICNKLKEEPVPIALLLNDKIQALSAMVGVIQSGHFFSALQPNDPALRLAKMLEDMQPSFLITSRELLQLARSIAGAGLLVVTIEEILEAELQTTGKGPQITWESYIAIIYTSGSTGEPKGTLRKHQALLDSAWGDQHGIKINHTDRIMIMRPLHSAGSLAEVLISLMNGATMLPYSFKEHGISPLANFIQEKEITIFRPPIQVLRYFLDSLPQGAYFPGLRCVIISGDVFYRRDIEGIRAITSQNSFVSYQLASSESSRLTSVVIKRDTVLDTENIPTGFPVDGKEIFLIDEEGRGVAQGEIGEIIVRAQINFAGYWRAPELTEARFMPDPAFPGQKVFRSGDLGRFLEDGQLEFIGRMDSRVKINGYSFELSNVELALMTQPGVQQAVALVRDDLSIKRQLVAYILPYKDGRVTAGEIRKSLAQNLPEYMVPTIFVIVDSIPMAATGKVDRKALPKPSLTRPELSNSYVPPRDQEEKIIAEIWRRTLKLDDVGVTDPFFELGGDSLMAASLMVSLERAFSRKLPMTMILKASTVRQQADVLRNEVIYKDDSIVIPVQPRGDKPPLFCLTGKGGNPMRFFNLIKYLQVDQPVYYFRARGLMPNEIVASSVQGIAADYISELKKIKPHGPYRFLGESGGGLVAYEMAQQLKLQGDDVDFLGMLDTIIPYYKRKNAAAKPYFILVLRKHIQTLTSGGADGLKLYVSYYIGLWKYKLYRFGQWLRKKWMLFRFEKLLNSSSRMERVNTKASQSYLPQPYPGRVHLFFAAEQARYENDDSHYGWDEIKVGELIIQPLDCFHGNLLFEPFVAKVAQTLNRYFEAKLPS